MDMNAETIVILYAGLGTALGLLRHRQGRGGLDAIAVGFAWPLDVLAGWLALLGGALARLLARGQET
jgi:hypothetical protein